LKLFALLFYLVYEDLQLDAGTILGAYELVDHEVELRTTAVQVAELFEDELLALPVL
jgi:hypothetical protein